MLTVQFQGMEDQRLGDDCVTFWAVNPGYCSTGFNGFTGVKDPMDGAEVVVKLLESSKKADNSGGTFWEFEKGELRIIPW